MDNYGQFYEQVYSQERQEGPHGWIQWKGTDVCMDLHCTCGYDGHVDCAFFYFYQCPKCGARYAVGQRVMLIPLTPEQIELGDIKDDRFETCELEEL